MVKTFQLMGVTVAFTVLVGLVVGGCLLACKVNRPHGYGTVTKVESNGEFIVLHISGAPKGEYSIHRSRYCFSFEPGDQVEIRRSTQDGTYRVTLKGY